MRSIEAIHNGKPCVVIPRGIAIAPPNSKQVNIKLRNVGSAAAPQFIVETPIAAKREPAPVANDDAEAPVEIARPANRSTGPPPQTKAAPRGTGRGSRLVTTSKKSPTRKPQKKQVQTLQALYQGRELAGYLRGCEALNAAGHSLGRFRDRAAACAAVIASSDKEATR